MRRSSRFLIALLAAALCSCATPPANVPEQRAPAPPPAASGPTTPTPPPTPEPARPPEITPVPPQPPPTPGPAAPAPPAAQKQETGAPVPVALLLPSQNSPFARAAEAVRLGFFAAHSVANANVAIQLLEVEDNVVQLRSALTSAQKHGARIVVGPLTRTLVNSLGDGRVVAPLPLLTLNLPESDAAIAPESLAFGLAVVAESRQVVRLALRDQPPPAVPPANPRFLILAGESPLDRRMATAFSNSLRDQNERATQIDVRVGYQFLQTLTEQLATLKIDAVFCALDARETAFVRPRLPRELPLYATSQVNLGGAESALLAPELEGVRFVDMPWLIEPEHAAVMVYPRSDVALSGELQRLYALGIDSYRVMLEWLAGRREFDLDGVTGKLHVDRGRSPRVERWPTLAVFRSGKIELLEQTQ
jgi:outer membrane PBP1 activator LpoA protein